MGDAGRCGRVNEDASGGGCRGAGVDRDAEGSADLVPGCAGTGDHAGLFGAGTSEDTDASRGAGNSKTEACHEHAGQYVRQVAAVGGDVGDEQQSTGGEGAGGYRTCWTVSASKKGRALGLPPRACWLGGTGGRAVRAAGYAAARLGVVAEVELGEVGLGAVDGELDGGLERLVEHERVAVQGREAGESIGRRNSHTAARSGL